MKASYRSSVLLDQASSLSKQAHQQASPSPRHHVLKLCSLDVAGPMIDDDLAQKIIMLLDVTVMLLFL